MAAPPERPPSDLIWLLAGETMGTSWSAKVIAPPGTDKQAVAAAIQAELDAVVAALERMPSIEHATWSIQTAD